jgi:transposase
MPNNNVLFCHRAVIEFLVKEEISAADIHHRLQRLYGDVCMGASNDRRWVEHFKDGNTSIQDQPGSGRPCTASTEHDKKKLDEIIKEDRRVTLDAIANKTWNKAQCSSVDDWKLRVLENLCPLGTTFTD